MQNVNEKYFYFENVIDSINKFVKMELYPGIPDLENIGIPISGIKNGRIDNTTTRSRSSL
jgi:hypothetical protein